ncbi:MAG: aldehyde dehydrogenase family protein [Candidatus Eisenbacteria bacterium]|nr:aldehyde dehydrogenase family protein [Candidatus Latescibacterota bacterium]MBD3302870.1 aldehyde dehydrogenase family protein [Candidatus Eisenbacteria bacterium]
MKRKTHGLYIDGEWVEAGEPTEIKSPYDQSLVGRHHRAGQAEVERALAAAERAFHAHRNDPASRRVTVLARMAEILERRREEFAATICGEAGKPIGFARAEVDRALHTIRCSSEEAGRIGGEVLPLDSVPVGDDHVGITRRFPVGPVLAITPFNFPLNLVCHKVGPAIASGCSIVLRPASQTPLTSLLLAEVAAEAELPAGLLNVVPSPVRLAEEMVTDPRIRLVTFTGSPLVGWPLKQKAAHRKVILELGGNAGVIFDEGYDPVPVIPKIAKSVYGYAGQSCISVQRIYAPKREEDRFVEAFVAHVRENVAHGDPKDEATVSGPLISSEETDRVMAWIAEARERGAELLCGGSRHHNVIEPTLLRNVDPTLKISCQEVFGPVGVFDTFNSFEEALAKVNDSEFGLQAGLFTHDLDHAFQAFRDLEVGGVTINETPTYRVDHMPYGGVKQSGFGREGIRYTIEEMTELRLMLLRHDFS